MLYSRKPGAEDLGLNRLYMIYAGNVWRKGQSRDEPIEHQVRATVREVPPGSLVCVDIEHWPVKGPETVDSIRKLIAVMVWIRDERPDLKLGYYGVLPTRDYWRALKGREHSDYQKWAQENKRLEELARHVDVIFPSLYTFYPDRHGWEKYARANLEQARIYNKPVYPFLWPQYHNSGQHLKGQYLDTDDWANELRLCYELADGIVIWGGWKKTWNDQAPWWVATQAFLENGRQRR